VSGGVTVINCIRFVLFSDALFCLQPNGVGGQARDEQNSAFFRSR